MAGTPTEETHFSWMDLIMQEVNKDRDPGEYPFSLGVEATNYCNLRCPMCPREIAGRGYGNMDYDLFRRIADEVRAERLMFLPQGFGESFIHPRFPEMLHYAHDVGMQCTMVVSNATYLNDKNINMIIDAQVQIMNLSVDGTSKETFEKIRVKADFDQVVANVKRLFEIREERKSKLPHIILRMIKMKENADQVEEFKETWNPYLKPGDEILFSSYQTWNNTVENKSLEKPEGISRIEDLPEGEKAPPCRMIYKTMQVYYDGRATPCCYDYDCTMEIGNAGEESIKEIWNGEKARHFRRLHEEGRMSEIPICSNCQEYSP